MDFNLSPRIKKKLRNQLSKLPPSAVVHLYAHASTVVRWLDWVKQNAEVPAIRLALGIPTAFHVGHTYRRNCQIRFSQPGTICLLGSASRNRTFGLVRLMRLKCLYRTSSNNNGLANYLLRSRLCGHSRPMRRRSWQQCCQRRWIGRFGGNCRPQCWDKPARCLRPKLDFSSLDNAAPALYVVPRTDPHTEYGRLFAPCERLCYTLVQ